MSTAPAAALLLAALTAGALLARGPGPGWVGALLAGACGLAAPWLVPASEPLLRALTGIAAAWGFARVYELARGAGLGFGPGRRLLHTFLLVDSRRLARAAPRLEGRLLLRAAAGVLVAAAGLWLVGAAPALRWVGGLAFVVAVAEAADAGVRAALRLAGFHHPPIQRDPLASRGVRELWSRRWNTVVQGWLSEHAYTPVARRAGRTAGLAAAFGASAALHAYLVLAPLGAGWAAAGGGFFVAQGALVLAELRLGQGRWPPLARRAWTLGALALTSPLFVEPALRCLER